MADGFWPSSSFGLFPVQYISPVVEGGTYNATNNTSNGSILLDPSGARSLVNLVLPNPPGDGQILTIASTKAITLLQFTPDVPSSPDTWDVEDAFQIKYFSNLGKWVLLR
jgi:hypothetical protein